MTLLDPSEKSLLVSKNKSHGKASPESTDEGAQSSAHAKKIALITAPGATRGCLRHEGAIEGQTNDGLMMSNFDWLAALALLHRPCNCPFPALALKLATTASAISRCDMCSGSRFVRVCVAVLDAFY